MKERGKYVSEKKWEKVEVINSKIDKYLQNGGKQEMCQVVSAFVTFETEEGYGQAVNTGIKNHDKKI